MNFLKNKKTVQRNNVMNHRVINRIIKSILFTGLISITSCTSSPTGRTQLMLISPTAAIVESSKAYVSTMEQLDNEQKLVNDPRRVKRLKNITGRLVQQAIELYPQTADWDWSVAIIDAPETLNAWCMAGGRMAIYTGIIDKLALTDDEVAQIMGHEIAHALANHTAERMSRAMATSLGLTAAAIFTDSNALALGGAAVAAKVALELPNSRTAEKEADVIGLKLATLAGYKPLAAVTLWQKMKKASGGRSGPEFLSTHPAPENRAQMLALKGQEFIKLNPSLKKSSIHTVDIVTDAESLN